MRPTLADLTADEQNALHQAHNGPVPAQAIADVIALRREPTVGARIQELRSVAAMWRACADTEARKLPDLMARRDASPYDAERDRLTREIAQVQEDRGYCLNKAQARDAEADALETPQAIAAE